LLVATGVKIARQEVLWLVHPELQADEVLKGLEPALSRSALRILTSDDETRTVRLAIGESVPWPNVLSLSFLSKP
jgi:hypothetical protein